MTAKKQAAKAKTSDKSTAKKAKPDKAITQDIGPVVEERATVPLLDTTQET